MICARAASPRCSKRCARRRASRSRRADRYGQATSIFVRGGQSNYTQVLIDGVVANDPGGAIDLANITTDNIDRIEIVRGPASVLYGANAVTGVIQIFTRRGHGPCAAECVGAGRHATARARARCPRLAAMTG